MVKLQCNVCGGVLTMQPDGNSVCENCGMIYKPKVVKQMATKITETVRVAGEVKVAGISNADKFAKNGETFLKLGEFDKASKVYKEMIKQFTDDYRGWWGVFLVKTSNLVLNPYPFEDDYKKAIALATMEVQAALQRQFNNCADNFCKKLEKLQSGAFARQRSMKYLFYQSDKGRVAYVIRDDGKLSHLSSHVGIMGSSNYVAKTWYDIESNGHFKGMYANSRVDDDWLSNISDNLHEIRILSWGDSSFTLRNKIKEGNFSDGNFSCYVATAVYGSYDAPEVLALRRFRDKILLKSSFGRKFVAFYYKHSPRYAEKLKKHRCVNRAVKFLLDLFVKIIENK